MFNKRVSLAASLALLLSVWIGIRPCFAEEISLLVNRGHTGAVMAVCYSPDGKILASGSTDGTILLWDIESGRELRTLSGHTKFNGIIYSVAFSPDGRTLASGSSDTTIKLWDVASGRELRTLTGHQNWVYSIAFSPDGKLLASGSQDRTIKLWNVASGKELRTLEGHLEFVSSVAFSPDGKTLVSGSGDRTAKIWDVAAPTAPPAVTGTATNLENLGESLDLQTSFYAADMNSTANRPMDWIRNPGGYARLRGVPFRILNGDRAVTTVEEQTSVTLPLSAQGVTRVFVLLTGNWGLKDYKDTRVGEVKLSFTDKTEITIPLVAMQNIRENWGYVGKEATLKNASDSSALNVVSEDQSRGYPDKGYRPAKAYLDMLIIPVNNPNKDLNSITFIDSTKEKLMQVSAVTVESKSAVARSSALRTLSGHSGNVMAVAFSPNGKYIATEMEDDTVKVWDAASGRELRTLESKVSGIGIQLSVADNKHVVISQVVENLPAAKAGLQCNDQISAIDGTSTEGMSLADIAWRLNGPPSSTLKLSVSRNNSVSELNIKRADFSKSMASEPRSSPIWVNRTEKILINGAQNVVAFCADGKTLVSGSGVGKILLWDWASGTNLLSIPEPHLQSLALSANSKTIAAGGSDNAIRIWTIPGGHQLHTLAGHVQSIKAVKFSPDGKTIVGADNELRLWDVSAGRDPRTLNGSGPIAFSSDGKMLASNGQEKIEVWDAAKGTELRSFNQSEFGDFLALTDDGKILASATGWGRSRQKGYTIKLLDTATSKEIGSLPENRLIRTAAFSPNGKLLVSSSGWGNPDDNGDYSIKVWDVSNMQLIKALAGHATLVNTLAFSPDGKMVASGSDDCTIKLWDAATFQEVLTLKGHTDAVRMLSFSPDGKTLASGSTDLTIKVWDVRTGNELGTLHGHEEPVTSIAFRPDGKVLVSGSGDGTMRAWALDSLRQLCTIVLLDQNDWVVADSTGRFDASDLDNLHNIHWIVPDPALKPVPLAAVPIELFMRQYYTPQLLKRTLSEEKFPQLPSIAGLNRTQPVVAISSINPHVGITDVVDVTVNYRSSVESKSTSKPRASGVYDLRIFRDGQLVGYLPESTSFSDPRPQDLTGGVSNRDFTRTFNVHLDHESNLTQSKITGIGIILVVSKDGRHFTISGILANSPAAQAGIIDGDEIISIDDQPVTGLNLDKVSERIRGKPGTSVHLRLLRNNRLVELITNRAEVTSGNKSVIFSAYAFNNDKVKSQTAAVNYSLAFPPMTKPGRAYVIAFGVNSYQDSRWNLKYAAPDARSYGTDLVPALTATGAFSQVNFVPMIADSQVKADELPATKAALHAVLDTLSGRAPKDASLATAISKLKLEKTGPDDFVLLAFSCHGDTDRKTGEYFLFPKDIGPDQSQGLTPDLERHGISSAELTDWLRDVDAGFLTMVIDSCHSAAASGENFKPGPMDSPGLGQLAYYKKMCLLSASQVHDVAKERNDLGHGLLTYALLHEGLLQRLADVAPKDGTITWKKLLRFSVEEVPFLDAQESAQRSALMRKTKLGVVSDGRREVEGDFEDHAPHTRQMPDLQDFSRDDRDLTLIKQ